MMRTTISFFLAILCFSFFSSAQEDTGKKTNINVVKVTDKIFMLQDKGGNIGLSVGFDGVFMIDDQFADNIEDNIEKIKTLSKKPIKFLVNTHFHSDHTGGNVAIAATGTTIISQENVRDQLEKAMKGSKEKIGPSMLPVITFKEDLTFYFNNERIFVFHVHDAHTSGDAMVYFTDSNVLHTGDVFFNAKYPYIDVENGGSLLGYIAALEKAVLVINEDTKIIPGHGKIGTVTDMYNTINMLTYLYKQVLYNHGLEKTLPEIIAMTEIAAEYEAKGYGDGYINREKVLTMVYNEVLKELTKK